MSQLNVDTIRSRPGGPPTLDQGAVVTGIVTATSFVGTAVTTDSQGIRAAGIVTATSFVGDMVGTAVTTDSQGIRAAGIVTATSFTGDGGNLTGLNIPPGTDWVEVSLF